MPPWQSRPAPPLRAAIVVSVWLSHVVLIPIYWNQAWIVRLPLPISAYVNASDPPFGGSGLKPGSRSCKTPRTGLLEKSVRKPIKTRCSVKMPGQSVVAEGAYDRASGPPP